MARRILNRREMRKASDQAEQQAADAAAEGGDKAPAKKGKAKADGPAKPRKPRKKKEPPRLCARWAVFDAGMKQIAVFDYNQKAEADQKVAELKAKKNAAYFIQIVKEPMPEPKEAEASPA
jgi:hypothetical protein